MRKLAYAICIICCIVVEPIHAQSYNQFIYKKPQQQRSFFKDFILSLFGHDPFDGSYAIVIGISDYDHLPRLDSPLYDTEKMKEFLLDSAEYDEVVVLKDSDANFETIRYFMQEYFPIKMSTGRYRFLFYFTGHGTQLLGYTGTVGYLQLQQATNKLTRDVINMEQIEMWANQLPNAKHMLFLLDCCFSGLAGVEAKGDFDTHVNPIELACENGRFMITAGGANERTIGSLKEWGGSLFTAVAISGMSGYADVNYDSIVTTHELYEYIRSAVKNEAQKQGYKQNPLLNYLGTGSEQGEYFFVYKPVSLQRTTGGKDVSLETFSGNSPIPLKEPEKEGNMLIEPRNVVLLRSQPQVFSSSEFQVVFRNKHFREYEWNPDGDFPNEFVTKQISGEEIIVDLSTDLIWQAIDANKMMTWDEAQAYVKQLQYAEFTDWRLPTIEELASLIEPISGKEGWFIDSVFTLRQEGRYWTSDRAKNPHDIWYIDFKMPMAATAPASNIRSVLAVRSIQQ